MHSAVLQNRKYIKFADANTVEVLVLSSLQKGIDTHDRKAATYKATDVEGNEVEYMVEFPGLTRAQVVEMQKTPAATFRHVSRDIPHTAFVDPFTLKMAHSVLGEVGSGKLIGLATQLQRKIRRKHGKPQVERKDLRTMDAAEAEIGKWVAVKKLAKALMVAKKLHNKAAGWPEVVKARADGIEKVALDYATSVLDELEALAGKTPKQAKSRLATVVLKLKGTPLEERAKTLLAKLTQ